MNTANFEGPYKYYVITLGGVGGQGSLDDNDNALRGGKHQNDYILHEYFYITNFQSF